MVCDGQGNLSVNPACVAERLHVGDFAGARPEGGLQEEARGGVGVGVVIGPGRLRRRRGESLRAVRGGEVAVDLAVGIIDGVNVDVGLAGLDDLPDVGGGQCADGRDVPNVTAIGLRSRHVNVENDLAGIVEVGVAVNVFASFRRAESAVVEFQNRLRLVRAHPQRGGADAAAGGVGLREQVGVVKRARDN